MSLKNREVLLELIKDADVFTTLEYYVLSREDIIVSKLGRFSEKDREDNSSNYRFDLVKELEAFKSIETFNTLKSKDLKRFQKLSTIILALIRLH